MSENKEKKSDKTKLALGYIVIALVILVTAYIFFGAMHGMLTLSGLVYAGIRGVLKV